MSAADKRAEKAARFYENIVPPATPEETHFRHGHWKERRDKVHAALVATGASIWVLNRFEECGSGCTVEWSKEENRVRLCASYCKNRHCEPCMKAKGNKIAANLRNRLAKDRGHTYRFITLSLKHTNTPLPDQKRRLYAAFKKMRETDAWKHGTATAEALRGEKDQAKREHRKRRTRKQIIAELGSQGQVGGAATFECKWQDPKKFYKDKRGVLHHGDGLWHPHLHIVSAGHYIDKYDLSKLWHQATGDSYIVDIRALKEEKDVAHYLSKYVAKGTTPEVWNNPDKASEWIAAARSIRTCMTFGTWRGYALTKSSSTATDWKPIATYNQVLAAARNSEEWAIGIMIQICPSDEPEEVRSRYVMSTGDG
jgi:hypothetical protein